MKIVILVALIMGLLLGIGLARVFRTHEVVSKRIRKDDQWEFKVGIPGNKPDEHPTARRGATMVNRALADNAAQP